MAKKFMRISFVALALCALLALSAFAFSTDLMGRVIGLEDGVDYTCAQYDFSANAYGEFTELTADTELSAGVWGIKAGDADPETLFVAGIDSGYINFFDCHTGLQKNDIFGGKLDDYIPGKWTYSTVGVIRTMARYESSQEILYYVPKDRYQTQVDETVAKVHTVDKVDYKVYAIGDAEYYLVETVVEEDITKAYYAVADGALFEGDASGAEQVFVTQKTWKGAAPIIGEDNLLQETVIRYGFTNEQVVPAKGVVKFAPEGRTAKAGSMYFNTNEDGHTYNNADMIGTFTWVVKTPGSDVERRYSIDFDNNTKEFVAPAEMAEDEGYLVAFEYAPYAKCPDDIFYGNTKDKAAEGYAYINLYSGRNEVTFNAELVAAPTVYDGYGVIGYDSEFDIEIAPVTISADGTELEFGEWTDYEYDIMAPRTMVGLYAVREKHEGKVSDYALAYAYGNYDERKTIGHLDEATGRVATVGASAGFVPGLWANTKWASGSSITTHSTFGAWYIGTTGGQIVNNDTINLKNAFTALAELKAAETPDADAIAKAEATLLATQKKIANQYNTANYTYGYKPEEIINVNEATSLYYSFYQNNANIVFKVARTKLIAFVADRNGNVTPYTKVIEKDFSKGGTIDGRFYFADFLPEEGWIVALQIYCATDIAPEEITGVNGTGNGRMLLSVAQANYVTEDAPGLGISDEVPEGIYYEKGMIKGLDADRVYEWTPFNLNGYSFGDWTVLPAGTTEFEYEGQGVVAIRFIGDGYSSSGSKEFNLAIGGSDNEIFDLVTKNTNKQKTVTVGGTAYNLFTIDGVEYYQNGDKYYAVADNSEYTGENAANAAKVFNTIDVPDTVDLADTEDNLVNIKFYEGKWAGIRASNYLAQDYGYSPLCIGCTATPIAAALARALQTAEASGDEAALATARANAAKKGNGIYYSYAYRPEEVIKMSDFVSIKLRSSKRQGGFNVVGSVVAKLVFKVINDDGVVVDRVVTKPVNYDWTGTTNTFTLADFEETDGYIVGLVYHPYVLTEGSYYSYNSNTNGDYDLYLTTNGYVVNRTLNPEKQPEGIVFDGNKITGLDADVTYEYGLYSIAGDIGEWTEVTGVTEVTFDQTGLVGIRVKGDGVITSSSLPVLTYVAGDDAARAVIGNMNGDKPVYDTSKIDEFQVGIWTGDYLSWYDQTAGAHSFLDQSSGVNCGDVETLWLYQNDRAYVEQKLAADALIETLPSHWPQNNVTSNPARLQGVINTHYGVANYAENLEANKLAHQTKIANAFATRNISYAFDETEILPVDELLYMSFSTKRRQGGFNLGSVKSKVVVHVMDENANVTTHEWWSDTWSVIHTGEWKKITADIQSIETLPEEGWIVGIEFFPWADVEPSSITAFAESRIDASSIAFAFGQQHVCIGYYPADYVIVIEAPEVTFDSETGVVSGLDAETKYIYAPYSSNGEGEGTTVTGVESITLTEGLWGIRAYVSDSVVSLPTMILVRADSTTASEIGNIISYGSYESYEIASGDVWEQGKWSGLHIATHSSFGKYGLSTLGGHIWSAGTKALYEAIQADDATAKEAAIEKILSDANAVKFRYSYADDEIVAAQDLLRISFRAIKRMGSLKLGDATAKVTFFVVDENGFINEYVWTSDRFNAQDGATFAVLTSDIENWPETGYVLGFQINPWTDLDPDDFVPTVDKDGVSFYSTMCTMTFIPEDYAVITGNEVTETPVITINEGNKIIVSNYNDLVSYVYSTDGGNTWTEFEGDRFTATKASAEYLVKSLANHPYEESEAVAVISKPVAVVGTTLVLDGRIGTRVYIEVDETLVTDITSLVLYATKVNSDYTNVEGKEDLKRIHGTSKQNLDWLSGLGYDEEKKLYFFTIYVAAKDADNTTVETEFHYKVGGTEINYGSVGSSFKVTSYIETAKAMAEAGDAAFVEALPLVEALEAYVNYADNYFNNGDDVAYVSTASMDGIAAPIRNNATLVGVEFYGTSLLLEDQVTIRHYFKVIDLNAFNETYNVEGAYETKGNFIYFDTPDISAQDIGTAKSFALEDKEGIVKLSIFYSVANYIKDMANDEDVNLASLVNAMYDYYLAAADYAK